MEGDDDYDGPKHLGKVAGPGAGPSGIEAARWLGLTTQVAGRPEIAVPGRVPTPIAGVRFCSRSTRRPEVDLTPIEVAVIQVLGDWSMSVEVGWDELGHKVDELAAARQIRVDRIGEQVADEHHVALRDRLGGTGSDDHANSRGAAGRQPQKPQRGPRSSTGARTLAETEIC